MIITACRTPSHPKTWPVAVGLALLLAACGGAEPDSAGNVAQVRSTAATQGGGATGSASPSAQPDARLTAQTLAQAEASAQQADAALPLESLQPGGIAAKEAYTSGQVATKAAAVRISAYRFYNGSTGAHFYTVNEAERSNVQANLSPPFSFEGPAFSVASAFSPGLSPVHRFFNARSGVHFYTISETERATVAATLPQFSYEGVAYHASQVAGAGLTPLYRFYVPLRGFHFYTASATERDNIVATLSANYTYEGVGYHVLASDWRAEKLPHTGITVSQCYRPGSDVLVTCAPTLAQQVMGNTSVDLSAQQDGHRRGINPMSYSQVNGNPATHCVKDNVTGLVWEVKDVSGLRSWGRTHTNTAGTAADNATGYAAAVNDLNLCGFNDWRVPTASELLSIVDYSKNTAPKINTTWFPNTLVPRYWTSETAGTSNAYLVSFAADGGFSYPIARTEAIAVRLVRGSSTISGPRFSYSSVAYVGDAANNLVNDALTGLQWRRCAEGMNWIGNACIGTSVQLNQQDSLVLAKNQAGWRLPNVKELNSLMERASASGGPGADPTAFPQAPADGIWSASPLLSSPDQAFAVFFSNGYVITNPRSTDNSVRLVRINP